MTIKDKVDSVVNAIPQFTGQKEFSDYVVSILGSSFGFHWVGLFLVDEKRENAVFTAGFGNDKASEVFLARGHRLPLHKNALISKVVNYAEIYVYKPIHPAPFQWGHEFYKCVLPSILQRDTNLEFQLLEEAKIMDWRTQSAVISPIGWDVCLPIQYESIVFGAVDVQIQLDLNEEEKRFWEDRLLKDKVGDVEFSLSACSGLQWLLNRFSSQYKKFNGI